MTIAMLEWTGGGDVQHVLLLCLAPTTGFVFMLMTLLVAVGKVRGRRTAADDAAVVPRPRQAAKSSSSAPHLGVRINGGSRHHINLKGAQSWTESSSSSLEENYSPAWAKKAVSVHDLRTPYPRQKPSLRQSPRSGPRSGAALLRPPAAADVHTHSQGGTEWPEDFVCMATLGQYATALMPRQKQGLPKQTASNDASKQPGLFRARLQELHTAVRSAHGVEALVAAGQVAPPAKDTFPKVQQPRNPRPSFSGLPVDPRFGPMYAPFDFSSTPGEGACEVWKIMLERNGEMRAVQRARLELMEMRRAVGYEALQRREGGR